MDLTWLNTFIIAAEELNFRRTAERLHLAQSTVTQHIHNLESALGTELFDRIGRHIQLNQMGMIYLKHSKSIVDSYVKSIESVSRHLQGYQETIRISVATLISTTSLPVWIREFSRVHPEIEFSIQVKDSVQVLENVMNQECDIGFSRIPTTHNQVQCIKLYEDPIVFVAPYGIRKHKFEQSQITDIFSKYLLFTHNHPLYWDDLLIQLRKLATNIRTMEVSKVHVTIEWIKQKMGVSFLPLSTVSRALSTQDIECVPFHSFALPSAHTYLLTRKNQSSIVSKFITAICEYPITDQLMNEFS